jgi:hypothetical protein
MTHLVLYHSQKEMDLWCIKRDYLKLLIGLPITTSNKENKKNLKPKGEFFKKCPKVEL